jgi:hypothetical protein
VQKRAGKKREGASGGGRLYRSWISQRRNDERKFCCPTRARQSPHSFPGPDMSTYITSVGLPPPYLAHITRKLLNHQPFVKLGSAIANGLTRSHHTHHRGTRCYTIGVTLKGNQPSYFSKCLMPKAVRCKPAISRSEKHNPSQETCQRTAIFRNEGHAR